MNEINLADRAPARSWLKLGGCLGLIIIGHFGLSFITQNELLKLKENDQILSAEIRKLNSKLARYQGSLEAKAQMEKNTSELRAKIDVIRTLTSDSSSPSEMLTALAGLLPQKLWLSEISIASDGMRLKGKADGMDRVAGLMKNIDGAGLFKGVELVSTQAGQGSVDFEITAKRRK